MIMSLSKGKCKLSEKQRGCERKWIKDCQKERVRKEIEIYGLRKEDKEREKVRERIERFKDNEKERKKDRKR